MVDPPSPGFRGANTVFAFVRLWPREDALARQPRGESTSKAIGKLQRPGAFGFLRSIVTTNLWQLVSEPEGAKSFLPPPGDFEV